MKIKPIWIILGLFGVFVLWFIFSAIGNFNRMVSASEQVDNKFADIQAQYQRRFDLIPQLVATVDMNAENEKEILTKVTQYRAGISDAVNAADIDKLEGLGTEIKSTFALQMEAYPTLKSPDAFRDLQAQLEGTENRIQKAREDFNSAVKNYNVLIQRFPGNMFNSMLGWGYEKKEGFKISTPEAEKPVDVRKEFSK
jgi:LemA protein